MQCLLIDDDPDDQEIFQMCAEAVYKNILCVTSNSGVEAILMLEENPEFIPEFIFIDVNMPKMNGIDCLEILKTMERLHSSKFYMYSTTSDRMSLENTRRLGVTEFIIKPTRITELKEKLQKIFSHAG